MPRVSLVAPNGLSFPIDTRTDDVLRAWFDDVLPVITRGWDITTDPAMAPLIHVWPSALTEPGQPMDWLADTRVIGRQYPFPYRDGASAMEGLAELRALLDAEMQRLNAAP